jgi:hypothetical protein
MTKFIDKNIKLFSFASDEGDKEARVFAPTRLFQGCLLFAPKLLPILQTLHIIQTDAQTDKHTNIKTQTDTQKDKQMLDRHTDTHR